ncbi:MAG TPA: hypothetical protein VL947_00145, partial [Cytophagales bacterium]|nr:hypothetical protein [Cytophagales bacterium]
MGIGDHVKTVGILGCGWIGYPLAVELVRLGFDVYGSTTQAQHIDKLKNAGLKRVFQGKLQPEWSGDDIKDLCNTDLLILCFPPGKTSEENFHLKQMEALSKQIGTHTKVIYTSSTSVYPELCREVFEDDVTDLSHTAHLKIMKAEVYLKEHVGDRLIILRCGGLTGWNRNLAKFFAGKTNLQGKDVPV